MIPRATKPDFYSSDHAAAFQFPGVAAAYWTRPPYPPHTFHELERLIVDEPRVALDAGCGIGNFARELAPRVDRMDALDVSAPMIEEARRQPGGDAPNIRWILGPAETAPLEPAYALIVAGAALHWFDWATVLPRFGSVLTPNGALAVVEDVIAPPAWQPELLPLILRYTTNPTLDLSWNWIHHLRDSGLLDLCTEIRTASIEFRQPVADYIESFHARESLTRERLGSECAAAFDTTLRAILGRYVDSHVTLTISAHIWVTKPKA